jgi:hypothetical protein
MKKAYCKLVMKHILLVMKEEEKAEKNTVIPL